MKNLVRLIKQFVLLYGLTIPEDFEGIVNKTRTNFELFYKILQREGDFCSELSEKIGHF